jgi:hypothetical protein
MKNMHWIVSTMYEMPHIERYKDAKKLILDLIHELEKHLGNIEVSHFAEAKDGSKLYLMQNFGVLAINTEEAFELRAHFITDVEAHKYRQALEYALQHALPKELADEMLSNLMIVETGAELEIED